MPDLLIDDSRPTVGLLVGTYAALPYVHLQLEAVRRFASGIPVLVHDDCSPQTDGLKRIVEHYGQDFVSTSRRRSHSYGDLAAFAAGFDWAAARDVRLLVKFSRRFLPLYPWTEDLQRLAYRLQYATYSSACAAENFGFRTECVAFHVPSWRSTDAVSWIKDRAEHNEDILVESFMHHVAMRVHERTQCGPNRRLEEHFPRPQNVSAYGDWWIGGTSRKILDPATLWHERNSAADYAEIAGRWGLAYGALDFQDPNVGMGLGTRTRLG